jgi:hypothetical protein
MSYPIYYGPRLELDTVHFAQTTIQTTEFDQLHLSVG